MDFTIPADICRLNFKKFSENFVNLLLMHKAITSSILSSRLLFQSARHTRYPAVHRTAGYTLVPYGFDSHLDYLKTKTDTQNGCLFLFGASEGNPAASGSSRPLAGLSQAGFDQRLLERSPDVRAYAAALPGSIPILIILKQKQTPKMDVCFCLELVKGIEPPTCSLRMSCSTIEPH